MNPNVYRFPSELTDEVAASAFGYKYAYNNTHHRFIIGLHFFFFRFERESDE